MNAFWILLFLIGISGFFALAEMSLASSRRSRLTAMAEEGDTGAQTALKLIDRPSQLLAATQSGITAVALLMGVYGESALSGMLTQHIVTYAPSLIDWADTLSFGITIVLVTCISIILGEIIPKRLAIAHPEPIAAFCAPFMAIFIKVLSPGIYLLSKGADLVLSFIPVKAAPAVTSVEDILAFVNEGAKSGELAPEESHMLGNVLKLEDRRLASMMTPISDVAFIELLDPVEAQFKLLREAPHSRLPVCRGGMQNVIGIMEAHDILQAALTGSMDLNTIPFNPPLYVPSSLSLVDLLRTFRQQKATFAFVVGEFGMTEGIITIDDLLQSVIGDMMPLSDTPEESLAVRRPDGSWLLDGLLPVDEMQAKLELKNLSYEDLGNFHTVGGFVIATLGRKLGRLPRKTEGFDWGDWHFEVVDVDKNRVDQVLATPSSPKMPDFAG